MRGAAPRGARAVEIRACQCAVPRRLWARRPRRPPRAAAPSPRTASSASGVALPPRARARRTRAAGAPRAVKVRARDHHAAGVVRGRALVRDARQQRVGEARAVQPERVEPLGAARGQALAELGERRAAAVERGDRRRKVQREVAEHMLDAFLVARVQLADHLLEERADVRAHDSSLVRLARESSETVEPGVTRAPWRWPARAC